MPTIDIALASYNGEKYISEQIASILTNQINTNGFSLGSIVVSDNMSKDNTASIVNEISLKHSNVKLLLNDKRGVINNFNYALENCTADYVMLCDQDDIWLPNKIQLSIQKLLALEKEHGQSYPLLVFSDLSVTDAELNITDPSFFSSQKIKPDGYRYPKNIFLSNVAPGCTMLINRKLMEMALPVPQEAVMHDWWLLLVASSFGFAEHINQATILYRQHGGNQVGAQYRRYRDIFLAPREKYYNRAKNSIANAGKQAHAFREYFPALPAKCESAITYLENFGRMSKWNRLCGLHDKIVENRTFSGTVLLYILAATLPRSK